MAPASASNGLSSLVFPGLDRPGLVHGVFSRLGGVSPPPWDTLNVGLGLGDEEAHVRENRTLIKKTMAMERLVSLRQVHGDQVLVLDARPAEDEEFAGYDALVSNISGVGLMIQQADCQAVLLHDANKAAIGILHAGWRGSAANIIGRTISSMQETFGCQPRDLRAAISPSLGPCCAEFVHYEVELPEAFWSFQAKPAHFDFWTISRAQLLAAGVLPDRIETAGICTKCDANFFSYRRERQTGRFASVIGLC